MTDFGPSARREPDNCDPLEVADVLSRLGGPDLPHVSFRRNRRLTAAQRRIVVPHRHDLGRDDIVDGIVTRKETTLLQCLRSLPDDEALVIADSAARAGELALLARVAASAAGRGAARVRCKVEEARADSANAFESVLRSIANGVGGLHVEPQRLITSVRPWVRPDLADEELRIVVEADSFAWHGDRTSCAGCWWPPWSWPTDVPKCPACDVAPPDRSANTDFGTSVGRRAPRAHG